MTTTDLIIIGAGPGGYHTAGYAAKHGLQIVIIEKGELGGTCLNVGCIPTKSFAHDADLYRNPLVPKSENGIDFKPILERKNQVVAQLVSGIATLLSQPGITLVKGEAHFVDAHTVEVGGEQYTAKNILIATGSQSKILPFMHDNPHIGSNVMTSTELLNIDFVPRRLCIIGAGVIGMEFASAFQTFGSEVTVVEFLKECLPPIDADIAKRMRKALEKRGIKFYMQSGVQDIRTVSGAEGRDTAVVTFERKGQRVDLEADVVLVATGRGAYMDHLNLEAAGVAYDRKGITVDDNMQTNVPGVYAIGDVNGRIQLAHAAEAQGLRAVNHILSKTDGIRLDVVPSAIFTYPEAACVGPTEDQLKQSGAPYTVRKSFYRSNGKAVAMEETEGLLKLFVAEDGKLLGCHVYGAHAADIVQEVSALICREATVEDLHDTIHIHPTLSEILLDAAM